MSHPTPPPPVPIHEPSLETVELLCERLGELGLPVGVDTARQILRAVLANESPRMDARVREALQISLETVRVAAQSALGVLNSTTPVPSRPPRTNPCSIPRPAVRLRQRRPRGPRQHGGQLPSAIRETTTS
jgi:hypothetical protein